MNSFAYCLLNNKRRMLKHKLTHVFLQNAMHAISSHLSEAKLNSYNAHPSSDQLKGYSDKLFGALSGSRLVFPMLSPIRVILLLP